jgi:hypothetical protein
MGEGWGKESEEVKDVENGGRRVEGVGDGGEERWVEDGGRGGRRVEEGD